MMHWGSLPKAAKRQHHTSCLPGLRTCERIIKLFGWEHFPSSGGGVAAASIKSCEATEAAADGVVAHTQMLQNALRGVTRERPPRPRLFGTGPFFDGASTPPLQGGECARL